MSKRMSFTILLALAFSVLLLFPLTANAAIPPMPKEKPTTAFYTYSGIVTQGPHQGMYLNGGLELQIDHAGKFEGYYYTPGHSGIPAVGNVDQRTGGLNISFQADRIHSLGAVKADGFLNKARTQYNGKFQIASDSSKDVKKDNSKDAKKDNSKDAKKDNSKDVKKDNSKDAKKDITKEAKQDIKQQDDSGIWTGVMVDDSAVPLAYQSVVKMGPDKGMIQSGVIILDKKTMKGMMVEASGTTTPCYAQKNDQDKLIKFVVSQNKMVGTGKMMDQQEGYAGSFDGPNKGDKGEWQALYITF